MAAHQQSFAQQLLNKLQSAILITVSIVATVSCLSLGVYTAGRVVDWARGTKGGTTVSDLGRFASTKEAADLATIGVAAYMLNSVESANLK